MISQVMPLSSSTPPGSIKFRLDRLFSNACWYSEMFRRIALWIFMMVGISNSIKSFVCLGFVHEISVPQVIQVTSFLGSQIFTLAQKFPKIFRISLTQVRANYKIVNKFSGPFEKCLNHSRSQVRLQPANQLTLFGRECTSSTVAADLDFPGDPDWEPCPEILAIGRFYSKKKKRREKQVIKNAND